MYPKSKVRNGEMESPRGPEIEGSNVARTPPGLTNGPNVLGAKPEISLTRMSGDPTSSMGARSDRLRG